VRSGGAYQVWIGARRHLAASTAKPVCEKWAPDGAIGFTVERAKDTSLYHCITRDGEEWATVAPSGEVTWLQKPEPKKKGRW